jgi:hypothetical protein
LASLPPTETKYVPGGKGVGVGTGGVAVGLGAACTLVRFIIHMLAIKTTMSGTLKKILVRGIMCFSLFMS